MRVIPYRLQGLYPTKYIVTGEKMCYRLVSSLECINEDQSLWGNKAVNLARISKKGFPVPKGFVISSSLFHEYIEKKGQNTLNPFLVEMDNLLEKSIKTHELCMQELIFRSSADIEGTISTSFCGIFDSSKFINNKRLSDCLVSVWESTFGFASKNYCSKIGINLNMINMAVIVQEFFIGSVYGVIQTKNVINSSDNIIIEYSDKSFDSVVSGKDNTSMLVMTRNNEVINNNCFFDLSNNQKKLLSDAAQSIENEFLFPVEIEFSLEDDKLAILQVRTLS